MRDNIGRVGLLGGRIAGTLVIVLLISMPAIHVLAQSGGPYNLSRFTVSGGGGYSAGGSYTLAGTIGQPDAGNELTGGAYALRGGFWTATTSAPAPPSRRIYLPLMNKGHNPSLADLIFHNGSLLTMEGASWDAQAIAIRDDTILAVGRDTEVLTPQGTSAVPGQRVILFHDDRYSPHHVPAPTRAELGIQAARFAVNWNPHSCWGETSPWPQGAKDAFRFAVRIWSSLLDSSQTIVVDACWRTDLPTRHIAEGGATSIHRDFANAPIASTWYAAPLANALANSDINDHDGGDADNDGNDADSEMVVEFNNKKNWYFGTDGNTPADKLDFASTALHELCHGLGFNGYAAVDTGDNECSTGTLGDGCLGWSGYPAVYDRFTEDGNGGALLDYRSPSARLGNALTGQVGGGVYFDGPNANAANHNLPVRLHAPNPWGGSSYSHLDKTFNRTPNSLMTHRQLNGVAEHHPGPVTIGMLQDMGWARPNTPPVITNLPDKIVPVNGHVDNAIDLWNYASDAESPDNLLNFSIANNPDPNAGVSIDSNRYVDIRPAADWLGETDVAIRVTDPGGLEDTDSSHITVMKLSSIHLPLALRGWTPQPSGWVTMMSEDFEGTFPGSGWVVVDENADSGLYYWGKRNCRSSDGSFSAWSVGAGDTTLSCGSDYPDNVFAWMVYGPFSLADASAAELIFDWWSDTEAGDKFFWGASTDDYRYRGNHVTGTRLGWTRGERLDLSAVPELGNLLGEDEVWIGFSFESNPAVASEGTYVDNVVLRKRVGAAASRSEKLVISQRVLQPNHTLEVVHVRRNRAGIWPRLEEPH